MPNYSIYSTQQRMHLAALPLWVADPTGVDSDFTLSPTDLFSQVCCILTAISISQFGVHSPSLPACGFNVINHSLPGCSACFRLLPPALAIPYRTASQNKPLSTLPPCLSRHFIYHSSNGPCSLV